MDNANQQPQPNDNQLTTQHDDEPQNEALENESSNAASDVVIATEEPGGTHDVDGDSDEDGDSDIFDLNEFYESSDNSSTFSTFSEEESEGLTLGKKLLSGPLEAEDYFETDPNYYPRRRAPEPWAVENYFQGDSDPYFRLRDKRNNNEFENTPGYLMRRYQDCNPEDFDRHNCPELVENGPTFWERYFRDDGELERAFEDIQRMTVGQLFDGELLHWAASIGHCEMCEYLQSHSYHPSFSPFDESKEPTRKVDVDDSSSCKYDEGY